jgi:hypothetical protein
MFTEAFDDCVSEGDTITCEKDGLTITALIERDEDMGPPWKEHDGHGPVSDWRPKDSKRPNEKILCEDRGSCRFYDWAAAIKLAKEDGWDAPPYGEGTPGQQAERAVQRDFELLKNWCADEWFWVSVTLSVSKNDVDILDNAASLGGVAANCGDDNAYLTTVANELLGEAVEAGKVALAKMIETLTA